MTQPPATRVFLALGFRPFYLGATLLAALAVPLWLLAVLGWWPVATTMPMIIWHAHEMLFGFAAAVIAGFLLTAARNWTGLPTAHGGLLAALFALWLMGRILNLTGPWPIAAWVDASFLPALALTLAVPLIRSGNRRNLFVVPLLLVLGAANLLHHSVYLGWTPMLSLAPTVAINTAVGLIALLMTIIGGRVIPAFSANAIQGLQPKRWLSIEVLAIGSMVAICLHDLAPSYWGLPPGLFDGLLMLAALAQIIRLCGWLPWRTRANGLLLMLPVAYAWLPVYLLLRATLGDSPAVIPVVALHAMTLGGMTGLMVAMMTRSALGHTGRPLVAGPAEHLIFWGIQLGALVRVLSPGLPGPYTVWIGVAGLAVALAFATMTIRYWPILTRPRVDGRPG